MRHRNPNPNPYFFLVAALAIYEKEGMPKQRHLNVLLELPIPVVTKESLGSIQRQVTARMHSENGVTPDMMRDVVIMALNPMGTMPREIFHGTEPVPGTIGDATAH